MTEQANAGSYRAPHFSQFVGEVCEFVDSLMPPEEVRQHFRNSRVEFWKGIRAIVDRRIDHLSRDPQQKGSAVNVE